MAKSKQKSNRTHLTWSRESDGGKCPECGKTTVLIVADTWHVDEESAVAAGHSEDEAEDLVLESLEVHEEITGHYCLNCERLCSLSFNSAN